jgi:hypothetical protein
MSISCPDDALCRHQNEQYPGRHSGDFVPQCYRYMSVPKEYGLKISCAAYQAMSRPTFNGAVHEKLPTLRLIEGRTALFMRIRSESCRRRTADDIMGILLAQ